MQLGTSLATCPRPSVTLLKAFRNVTKPGPKAEAERVRSRSPKVYDQCISYVKYTSGDRGPKRSSALILLNLEGHPLGDLS